MVTRSNRRLVVSAVVAGVTAAASGCAAIFGIEDRPLVSDASTNPTSDASDAGEASDGCVIGKPFCESICPRPDFCDDFDQDAPLDQRWKNSAVSRGTLDVLPDPEHGGVGKTLFATLDGGQVPDAAPGEIGAAAFVLERLGEPGARGLYAKFRVRFAQLGLDPIVFADAALPGPSVAVAGFLDQSGAGVGLTAWRDENLAVKIGFVLRKARVPKYATRPLMSLEVSPENVQVVTEAYGTYEIAFGPPDVLAANGFGCMNLDASTPYAIRGTLLLSDCVALPDITQAPEWLTTPSISAGAILTGSGNVTIAIDGVAVRYLR